VAFCQQEGIALTGFSPLGASSYIQLGEKGRRRKGRMEGGREGGREGERERGREGGRESQRRVP